VITLLRSPQPDPRGSSGRCNDDQYSPPPELGLRTGADGICISLYFLIPPSLKPSMRKADG
jgi:hypothetical protein